MNARRSNIFLILGFLIVSIILYIIYKTPNANGYELTIYEVFPNYFFILFIIVNFLAFSVIYLEIIDKPEKIIYSILAFFLILFSNAILLSLGDLHGYWLYGRGEGDVLYHIGVMKDILSNGNIIGEDYYPFSHIMGAIMAYLINIPLEKITTLIRISLYLSFPLSIYFLSSSMFKSYWKRLLISSFSTLMLFSVFSMTFHPSIFSIYLIPFVLGSYQYKSWQNKKELEFSILILFFIFVIIFMHPMTTVFLVVVLFGYLIIPALFAKSYPRNNPSLLILIILIVFVSWYLSFVSIGWYIDRIYRSIFFEPQTSIVNYYTGIYSSIELSIYSRVKYLFWNYGHLVLLYGIGVMYICSNVYKYYKYKKISLTDATYSYFQLIGFLLSIALLLSYFIEYEIIRVSRLATMFSVVTIGLFSINLIQSNKKYIAFPFICIILLSSFFVFNIYSSPFQSSPNYQMTHMEYSGLDWIVTHRNETISFISGTNIQKNGYYLLGYKEILKHPIIYIRKSLPINFGVNKYDSLKDAVKSELNFNDIFYTIYSKDMEITYKVLPTEVWDIATKYDKKYIKNDHSVNVIYSSGEQENWLIK